MNLDAAFLQNALQVFPRIHRVSPWAGIRRLVGAVKPLPTPRPESIEVRRRQGSTGWLAKRPRQVRRASLGARASGPLIWRTLAGQFSGGGGAAGLEGGLQWASPAGGKASAPEARAPRRGDHE